MKQQTLKIMDEIIPWKEWIEFIKPYYPHRKAGAPTDRSGADVADVSATGLVQSV